MDIEEARKMQVRLQHTIRTVINVFEEDTKTVVTDIQLIRMNEVGKRIGRGPLHDVEIKVEL